MRRGSESICAGLAGGRGERAVKEVLEPGSGTSLTYWLTILRDNGGFYKVAGVVVALFIILYLLFRAPKS